MNSYISHEKRSGLVSIGGLQQVAQWARDRIVKSPKSIIAIIKCRPSEGGRVVAEMDINGNRIIEQGRRLSNKDVLALSARSGNG